MAAASFDLPVCDPHFHLWDSATRPNPNLGGIVTDFPVYAAKDYAADFAALDLRSCVHVEAIVGQKDGGFVLDPVAETRWVAAELSAASRPFRLVPYVHLGRDDAAAVLDAHLAASPHVAGVRMILNFDEEDESICWPQVGRGDFLRDGVPAFVDGMRLLQARGLRFDLQCNPHQLTDAYSFLRRHGLTDLPVALNHMGCLRLNRGPEEDARNLVLWRDGMTALASLPNVTTKLSMFPFTDNGAAAAAAGAGATWLSHEASRARVLELVRETVDRFGPERTMAASNYPVDRFLASPVVDSFVAYRSAVAHRSRAEQVAVFHDTAAAFYGLPTSAELHSTSSHGDEAP